MFKGRILCLACAWVLWVAALGWFFYYPSEEDQEAYRHLMALSESSEKKAYASCTMQQTREKVGKQLLAKQGPHRLQTRLSAQSSCLILEKKLQEIKLSERFQAMEGMMQEKLSEEAPLKQVIRQFKTEEAIFSYSTWQLQAREMEVSRHLFSGHQWPVSFTPLSSLIKGQAKHVDVSLLSPLTLKAQEFRASWQKEEEKK